MKQRSCYNQNMLSEVTQQPIVSGDGGMVLGSCERHDGGNVDHQYGRSDASSRPPSPGPHVTSFAIFIRFISRTFLNLVIGAPPR
jgi:hypothetical protein